MTTTAVEPIVLNFDLNNGCNLHCVMCAGRAKPSEQQSMPLHQFKDKVLPLFRHLSAFQFGCGCEPLLLPYFDEAVRLIGKTAPATVKGSLITNGTLLRKETACLLIDTPVFTRIRFSWEASHRELFESIRCGASFERLLEKVNHLISVRNSCGSSCSIEFNVTILKQNIRDLPAIVTLAASLGIDRITTHKLFPDDKLYVPDEYAELLQEQFAHAADLAKKYGITFESQSYRTCRQYQSYCSTFNSSQGSCHYLAPPHTLEFIMSPSGEVISPCLRIPGVTANLLTDDLLAMRSLGLYNLFSQVFAAPDERCLQCHHYHQDEGTSLSIHFFTIVLNGEPFIRHHIDIFTQLEIDWHWHIVEGVADLVHDTAWSVSNGGQITGELHANGLSNDGTSQYLDELATRFPEQITLYRKPAGQFWNGKLEMVNAPLANISEECLLWQVDSDELWNAEQISCLHDMFVKHPQKTAAQFICNFYVGPGLAISSIDTYGNHTHYEWFRCWRYTPCDRWLSHEPPRLGRKPHDQTDLIDVGAINPFNHLETASAGLIFDHFAYVISKQVIFKQIYYGYTDAVDHWNRLQQVSDFPVLLRNYFPWVIDETTVKLAPLMTIRRAHIIYLRTDAIGDNVLAAGMLPHIKDRYPGATITIVCQDRVAPLYDACPFADGVISFNYLRLMTQPGYRQLILDKMNSLRPTLLLNPIYSHDLHDEFLAHHCAAPLKISYEGDTSNRTQEKLDAMRLLYSFIISNNHEDITELDRHLSFLKGLGIPLDKLMPQVWTSTEDEQWADSLIKQQGISTGEAIMLFPGALIDCKTYPHYAEVLGQLKGHPLIVLGGVEARERGDLLCQAHGGHALNLAGQTSLGQMAALMRRGKLYVGSDSAGMHIACAVSLRNVVLLGGGHFGRFCPYSALTTAICLPLQCYHCNWQCPHQRVHCLHDINPETVVQTIRITLAEEPSHRQPSLVLQQSSSYADTPSVLAKDALSTRFPLASFRLCLEKQPGKGPYRMESFQSDAFQQELYKKGLFFLSDNADFSYASTCLADGLHQLGIPIYSNISYHDPLITDFAFCATPPPQNIGDIAAVVLDLTETLPLHNQRIQFDAPHPKTIIICMQDNAGEICFPDQISFCTHENRLRSISGTRIPIAFGISSGMLREAQRMTLNQPQRNTTFAANFRPSEAQSLRASLDLSLIPMMENYFTVDKALIGHNRWGSDYYNYLSRQFGCLAYGGFYSQNLLLNDWFKSVEPLNTFLQQTQYHRDTVVLRWDSWRFWESLLFGCVTIHLDFEQYGFALPVMPDNWKHYIGLNLFDLRKDVERIRDEWDRLPEIAEQGRLWALEHYSPLAVARRFITNLQNSFEK